MNDQAGSLRKLAGRGNVVELRPRRDRTIAVTGGKGGVGKSTIALNLAMAYARTGANTLAVDSDLGMADLNLLLGVAPEKSLLDVLGGDNIEEVVVAAHGIHLLPALNGSHTLATLDDRLRAALFSAIDTLEARFDTLVIDVAAGIGENAMAFAGAAEQSIIVTTPEPLSLADAYACLKALATRKKVRHALVLPNRVRSPEEAQDMCRRLESLTSRFLGITVTALPSIPEDPAVRAAAVAGVPLLRHAPDAPASRAIMQVARRIDGLALTDNRQGVTKLFWKRMLGGNAPVTGGPL